MAIPIPSQRSLPIDTVDSPFHETMLAIQHIVLMTIFLHQQTCLAQIVPRKSGEEMMCDLEMETAVKELYFGGTDHVHCRADLARWE